MSVRNGTSWSGRCEGLTDKEYEMGNYAGVDWASDKHDVLVADERGERLLAATFAHDEQGLRSLCRQLVRLKVALVAIERPDGLLASGCLMLGCGCSRCTLTRSRPPAIASGSRAVSRIPG